MTAAIRPFQLHVGDDAIDDLRERLARTRFPDQAPGEPWADGTDVAYLRELVEYWRTRFDWRAQEAALNAFPQFKVALHGIDLHFLHVEARARRPSRCCSRTAGRARCSSFSRSFRASPTRRASAATRPMRSPSSRRRSRATASRSRRARRASASSRSPTASPTLMRDVLGYPRFAAQGGDWGAFVASRLGAVHADKLIGIHLNLLAVRRDPTMRVDPTAGRTPYHRRARGTG